MTEPNAPGIHLRWVEAGDAHYGYDDDMRVDDDERQVAVVMRDRDDPSRCFWSCHGRVENAPDFAAGRSAAEAVWARWKAMCTDRSDRSIRGLPPLNYQPAEW